MSIVDGVDLTRPHPILPGKTARPAVFPESGVGSSTTTRQAAILNTAVVAAPTGIRGIVNGQDALSGAIVSHDPATAYNLRPRLVTSPNTVIVGDVGSSKSSFVKTVCVVRPLLLRNRRAFVFDKKNQNGEGEYAETTRRFGAEPIRFAVDDDGVRLNLLDPLIALSDGLQGQYRLLNIITRLARPEGPLTTWEEEALRRALRNTYRRDTDRTPVLNDLLELLGTVAGKDLPPAHAEQLEHAGLSVRFALAGLLDEYGHMLDGETSTSIDLAAKLTSFDVSQLPSDGPAIPVVMAFANMWVMGRLKAEPGYITTMVYDEGWHLTGGAFAELLRSNQRLSRSLGINNVFVMHKGTDVRRDSPAIAMIQEAHTVCVFRQSKPEDAQWCTDTFGFEPATADTIPHLPTGHFILKIASQTETQVRTVRSRWEEQLTDTDEAMSAAAAQGSSE